MKFKLIKKAIKAAFEEGFYSHKTICVGRLSLEEAWKGSTAKRTYDLLGKSDPTGWTAEERIRRG